MAYLFYDIGALNKVCPMRSHSPSCNHDFDGRVVEREGEKISYDFFIEQ